MKVVIPSAGRGTRLLPHTLTKPKQLIQVAGKAILGHLIDEFLSIDAEEYIFVVGYLGDQIEEYVEQCYPEIAVHFVEQKDPLGQAHAITLCRDYVEGPVLIVFSDTLTDVDFSTLDDEAADAVCYVKEIEDPRRFGVAVVGEDGFVTHFVEKPDSMDNRLAVIGMYYVKDAQLLMKCCDELVKRNIQTKGEYYLADAFTLMIKEYGAKFRAHPVDVWEDCGKPETLLQTNRYLLDHGHSNPEDLHAPDSIIIPPVSVGKNVVLDHSIVGPYASLADGSVVRHSLVSDSIIGKDAVVEESILDCSLIGDSALVRGRPRKLNVGDSSQIDFAISGE